RRFDYCGVKRGAPNGVDAVLGIDIVRREMQCAGFIMNHPATHRDRVTERFVSDPDLFERMNPTRRNCQIDRTSANNVAFARISSPLVKIDFVAASPKVRGQQTSCEAAADKNEFSGHQEFLTADYADITGIRTRDIVSPFRGTSNGSSPLRRKLPEWRTARFVCVPYGVNGCVELLVSIRLLRSEPSLVALLLAS